MAWFGPKWVRASRKAGREYFKKIFPFLLVVYETLWCAKFQRNWFSDAKINGPLLGRLPLKIRIMKLKRTQNVDGVLVYTNKIFSLFHRCTCTNIWNANAQYLKRKHFFFFTKYETYTFPLRSLKTMQSPWILVHTMTHIVFGIREVT